MLSLLSSKTWKNLTCRFQGSKSCLYGKSFINWAISPAQVSFPCTEIHNRSLKTEKACALALRQTQTSRLLCLLVFRSSVVLLPQVKFQTKLYGVSCFEGELSPQAHACELLVFRGWCPFGTLWPLGVIVQDPSALSSLVSKPTNKWTSCPTISHHCHPSLHAFLAMRDWNLKL